MSTLTRERLYLWKSQIGFYFSLVGKFYSKKSEMHFSPPKVGSSNFYYSKKLKLHFFPQERIVFNSPLGSPMGDPNGNKAIKKTNLRFYSHRGEKSSAKQKKKRVFSTLSKREKNFPTERLLWINLSVGELENFTLCLYKGEFNLYSFL